MVVYSLLLIVLMLTRPSGIFGTREIWDIVPVKAELAESSRLSDPLHDRLGE